MLLLKQLDKKDPVKVKAYRVHVKARLYRFNYVSRCSTLELKEANVGDHDTRRAKRGTGGDVYVGGRGL